jgi:ribonuclease VapC
MTEGEIESVFDTSTVLALIKGERGAREAGLRAGSAGISAINWAEVWAVAHRQGVPDARVRGVQGLGLRVVPLEGNVSELAAGLRFNLSGLTLSLADCCCLALGIEKGLPVYTADREWLDLELDVDIRLIR